MAHMAYAVKVWWYFFGLTIKTKNFAFEIKVLLDVESTHPGCQMAKIGLHGPDD